MKTADKFFCVIAGMIYLVQAGGIAYMLFFVVSRTGTPLSVFNQFLMFFCMVSLVILPFAFILFAFVRRKGWIWQDVLAIVWTCAVFIFYLIIPERMFSELVTMSPQGFLESYIFFLLRLSKSWQIPLDLLVQHPLSNLLLIGSALLIAASVFNMAAELQWKKRRKGNRRI